MSTSNPNNGVGSTAAADEGNTTAAVGCGCRPSSRRSAPMIGTSRDLPSSSYGSSGRRKRFGGWKLRRRSKYEDAVQFSKSREALPLESFYFFDAEQDPLEANEFPAFMEEMVSSILKQPLPIHRHHAARASASINIPSSSLSSSMAAGPGTTLSIPIKRHPMNYGQSEPSERFQKIMAIPSEDYARELRQPRVKLESGNGYPGHLTPEEIAECQKFLDLLENMDPSVAEQVFSFRDIEEPVYTICRWVRGSKFNAQAILQRCQDNQVMFDDAKEQSFYPDVSSAIGAPFSVFLSQYPYLPVGRGKIGCPVNYFQAGEINPEGIMALTTIEQLEGYFWWSFMYKMKSEIRTERKSNPDFVQCEGINVIDLKGMSRSALSSDTMQVIKLASKVSDFFPETLNSMLILNAPGFFIMAWGLIKKFVDPQTARRIRVVGKDQGLKALQEIVDISQIPRDYGGNNISLAEAFRNESNDPLLLRQQTELVQVKRKSKSSLKTGWRLDDGECMELKCYTRSCSAGRITVSVNGEVVSTLDQVMCTFDSSGSPKASCKILGSQFVGKSGGSLVNVELQDLDNADKKNNGRSRGYFLLVGDVKNNGARKS